VPHQANLGIGLKFQLLLDPRFDLLELEHQPSLHRLHFLLIIEPDTLERLVEHVVRYERECFRLDMLIPRIARYGDEFSLHVDRSH
jgi:hypothetical protein